jgi:ubiquinone/menaquinone biosynthesis C-methylase UbiE
MADREQTYWWHLGRLKIIQTYVEKAKKDKKKFKIMNVGCGTGGTINMLERYGSVDNVDVSDEAIKFMKKCGYTRLTKVDDIKLPFNDKTYDMVGAFDVLEHIDKQVAALREWSRVLKDDGAIVVTVPAYQWLWTEHDVSLHHYRRYTTKRLAAAAAEAGLVPQKKSYAIVFSLPLVVGFRYLNKLLGRKNDSETSYVDVPNWINSFFSQLLYVEAKIHNTISLPVGTSVVGIFRKAK